jgi:phosphoglycerate kinase
LNLLTIDDLNFKDKTVLVRADLNTSYNESRKKIEDSERLRMYSKTIKELSRKKAKVVVLAHQGRKGNPDFTHLDQHAKLLSKHIGKKVYFVEDIIGNKAINRVKNMKNGDIILLDNVRLLDEEVDNKTAIEHSKSKLVTKLSPLADIFVNDAFSVAHRSHASLVGFTPVLPSVAGRVMMKEWISISELESKTCSLPPIVYVLGGDKPDDCLKIIERLFERGQEPIKTVLTCGVIGELFILAKGYELGKATCDYFERKKYSILLKRIKFLLKNFSSFIHMPCDLAFKDDRRKEISLNSLPAEGLILDIGEQTIKKYFDILKKANCVVVKGTPGAYENKGFDKGTKRLLEIIADLDAFTLIGGGDTNRAIRKLGIEREKFSYVSLAGGAFINALSGEKLPAIEALKESKKLQTP